MSSSKITTKATGRKPQKRQVGQPAGRRIKRNKFNEVLEPSEPQDVYTDPELVRIYQTLKRLETYDSTWRSMCFVVRCFLGTGLRINEARWVRLEDIHMEYLTPVIEVMVGKGGRRRMAQVTPEFASYLRRRVWFLARIPHAEQVEGPFSWWDWTGTPKGWLFRSYYRSMLIVEPPHQMSDDTLRLYWKKVIAQCGVRYLPPHRGGRATFITQETERVALHKLADTAGHTLAIMDKYYRRGIPGRNYAGADDPPMWRGVA